MDIILYYIGYVGSTEIKVNEKVLRGTWPRWATMIAATVGIKKRMIYTIIKNYIADGF